MKMNKGEAEELERDIKYDPRYKKDFTLTTHLWKFSVYTLKEDGKEEQVK